MSRPHCPNRTVHSLTLSPKLVGLRFCLLVTRVPSLQCRVVPCLPGCHLRSSRTCDPPRRGWKTGWMQIDAESDCKTFRPYGGVSCGAELSAKISMGLNCRLLPAGMCYDGFTQGDQRRMSPYEGLILLFSSAVHQSATQSPTPNPRRTRAL